VVLKESGGCLVNEIHEREDCEVGKEVMAILESEKD